MCLMNLYRIKLCYLVLFWINSSFFVVNFLEKKVCFLVKIYVFIYNCILEMLKVFYIF